MPIIKNPPKKRRTLPYRQVQPSGGTQYTMRVWGPKLSPVEKFYKSLEQLERYRDHYKNKGLKTRRLTVI